MLPSSITWTTTPEHQSTLCRLALKYISSKKIFQFHKIHFSFPLIFQNWNIYRLNPFIPVIPVKGFKATPEAPLIKVQVMCTSADEICGILQSVTYRYREFFIFCGIGTSIWKNWYQKKSRNRYQKNLVSKLNFVAKILEFRRIYNGYRYRICTSTVYVPVPGIVYFFWWYREISYRKKYRNRYQ